MEKLEHAKQALDSDDEDDYGNSADDKGATTRTSIAVQGDEQIVQEADCDACTPSKRKRHILEAVVIPVKQSPQSTIKTQRSSLPPPSRSPSPPASPSLRASKRGRVEVVSAVVIPSTSPVKSKTSNGNGINALPEKRAVQQATLSSFFAPKAGQGTGILKSRTIGVNGKGNSGDGDGNDNGNENGNDKSTLSGTSVKTTGSANKKLPSAQEPPKKLEQLFLSFSKDRTKKSTSSSGTTPGSKTLSASRPTVTRLSREDERLKRYHCPQCGMPYVRGQPEDEQIHEKYHRAALGGIDYPGYKNEVVVATHNDLETAGPPPTRSSGNAGNAGGGIASSSNSRIVMVSMSDTGKPTTSSSVSSASSFEKRKVGYIFQKGQTDPKMQDKQRKDG